MARRPYSRSNPSSRFRGPLVGAARASDGQFEGAPAELIGITTLEHNLIEFKSADDIEQGGTNGWVVAPIGSPAVNTFVLRTAAADIGTIGVFNAGTADTTGQSAIRANHIDSIPFNSSQSTGETIKWGWGARVRLDDTDAGTAMAGLAVANPLAAAGTTSASISFLGFKFAPSGTSSAITVVYNTSSTSLETDAHPRLLTNNAWVNIGMQGTATSNGGNNWIGVASAFVDGIRFTVVNSADFSTAAFLGGARTLISAVNGVGTDLDFEVDYIYKWNERRTA